MYLVWWVRLSAQALSGDGAVIPSALSRLVSSIRDASDRARSGASTAITLRSACRTTPSLEPAFPYSSYKLLWLLNGRSVRVLSCNNHGLLSLPGWRRPHGLEHFLHQRNQSAADDDNGRCKQEEGGIPGSAVRAPWPRARSAPAPCTTAAADDRPCSRMCRGGCLSSTPNSSCQDGLCRCTWPGAARAPAACGACRPV